MRTWNAASAGALSITKNPAIPRKDPDMNSAACTTLRLTTTPSAETSVIPAGKKKAVSSRVVLFGNGTLYGSGSLLGCGFLLLLDGGFGIHRGIYGPLAELPGELQPIVRLSFELLGVVDAVDRADLDAEGTVHAARVVYDKAYRVGLRLAGAVDVTLLHLYGDTVVGADPHALQACDAPVHVDRQQPAAALRERTLVLGVLTRNLLREEVPEGDPHPLYDALSYLRHIMSSPLSEKRWKRQHRAGGDEQPENGERNEHLPTQVHQLVHAQARQGPADPQEGEHEKRCLEPEPDPVEGPEVKERERRLPAPEEQRRADGRHQPHQGELGGLDQSPGHP